MKTTTALLTALPVIMLLTSGCNPDPKKVLEKNRDLLSFTFSQMQKAGTLVRGGHIPSKKIGALPDKIRIMNSYYTSADYDGHNAVLATAAFFENPAFDPDEKLGIGWGRPLANLADAFLRNNLYYYEHTWGAIRDDMKALKKIRYLLVCRNQTVILPRFDAGTMSFGRGEYAGEVFVFRLSDLHYFGSAAARAASSATVDIPGRYGTARREETRLEYDVASRRYVPRRHVEERSFDRGGLDRRGNEAVLSDFNIQVGSALERAVPFTTWSPFDK